ncbi:MAG: hypothetical protein BGO55_24100 [Sphingobacteriales bacterium 50-39]|nr:hypothetical protein [Sphingobacteriales bacterium]OJW58382.1 MAG: hypothetical protein BGO55_24100 [Sphingobacteriales bacterium 50-39]
MEQEKDTKSNGDDVSRLEKYKEELIAIHHKSQETFEQQLSYISAGSLALSIGFVKDIVKDIDCAGYRPLLGIGWVLMVITLLLNLVSHLLAVKFYRKSISEIHRNEFVSSKSDTRFDKITWLNWTCVGTLVLGILLIIIFVNHNL